jgi:hypothetical protein
MKARFNDGRPMEYRRLGNSNLDVSAVCLGTMTFGDQNTEAEAHAQLDYAISQGINFIDTAEMYPMPPKAETCTRTETIVGNWLKKQPRDKIILGTKVAGPRRKMEWIRSGPKRWIVLISARPSKARCNAYKPITSISTNCTGRSATCRCLANTSSTRRMSRNGCRYASNWKHWPNW